MSEEESVQLIEALKVGKTNSHRDRAIFEVLYSTGIRVSELVGLNVEDVDFIGNIIKVMGKGKKERIVPIGEHALNALKEYLDKRKVNNKFVFANKNGTRLGDEVSAISSTNIFLSKPCPSMSPRICSVILLPPIF